MNIRKLIALFICILILSSCDDIIEVPDISNQKVFALAPLDGTTIGGNQVKFNWEELLDADDYRVQLATPSFENAAQLVLDSLFIRDTLGRISTTIQLPLLNGNYQWRVKGLNSGFETPFTTMGFTVNGDPDADITPPNNAVLVAPIDGKTQDETTVNFSWTREDISGSAEGDNIFIYTDENLQTLETKGLGANKTFEATLSSGTYYWLVQSFDAAGNKGKDSGVFKFTIN